MNTRPDPMRRHLVGIRVRAAGRLARGLLAALGELRPAAAAPPNLNPSRLVASAPPHRSDAKLVGAPPQWRADTSRQPAA
jgi:hypothetical protein